MEQPLTPAAFARRDEDIALDLLKFVAATAGVGRVTGPTTTGFIPGSSTKAEDQVSHLLELYTRCLNVIANEGEARKTSR